MNAEDPPYDPASRRARYERAMADGQREYQDVLDRLNAEGLPAEFTQTGGMNAALLITFEGGTLLVTDEEDSLTWRREDHRGWGVGLYPGVDPDQDAVRFETTSDSSLDALLDLVRSVLLADS